MNFSIRSVYLKDVSYEAPNVPQVFQSDCKPQLDFDIQINTTLLAENLHEVDLHLTVTSKMTAAETESSEADDADKIAFLVEVHQAGIFEVKDFSEEQAKKVLQTACPTILYPYVREVISSLVTKGGFPQLLLPPMNFEALQQEQQTAKTGAE